MSTFDNSSALRTRSQQDKVLKADPYARQGTSRNTATRTLTQFARGFLPKKDTFGLVDLKDTCGICRELPESSGEKWCALPCGHKFGHRCLRTLLAHRRLRHCPTCNESVARACGHPITPVPVRATHHIGILMEVRRVAQRLQAQMRTECGFCKDQRAKCEDAVAVLAALDINVDRALSKTNGSLIQPGDVGGPVSEDQFEREWREWWDETTAGPRSVEEASRKKKRYHYGLYLV